MQLIFIRHGQTAGNLLRRYIGRTDEPLCPQGIAAIQAAAPGWEPDRVFLTPLLRTQQTAALLFPHARQIVIPALREMDFGAFEGRSADEMTDDDAYRAWVDGGCLDACPAGESRDGFIRRVCDGFVSDVLPLLSPEQKQSVFVVHGGTIMALLSRFARPQMNYYSGAVGNGQAVSCRLEYDAQTHAPVFCDVQKPAQLTAEARFPDENAV